MDFRAQLVIGYFVTGEYVHELPSSEVLMILSRKYEKSSCASQSNCLSRFFPFPYVSNILCIDFAWLKLFAELLHKRGSNERTVWNQTITGACKENDFCSDLQFLWREGAHSCSQSWRVNQSAHGMNDSQPLREVSLTWLGSPLFHTHTASTLGSSLRKTFH